MCVAQGCLKQLRPFAHLPDSKVETLLLQVGPGAWPSHQPTAPGKLPHDCTERSSPAKIQQFQSM